MAHIVERLVRSGTSPSYEEIGKAMRPRVGKTRVRQLVDQLIKLRVLEREPGAQRAIRIRDLGRCRAMIEAALVPGGWWQVNSSGVPALPAPCTIEQLPLMPAFRHIPDVD